MKYQPVENIGKLFFPNLFRLVCLPRRAAHKAAWIVCFLFALMKISFAALDPPWACCFWLWLINNYTRGSCIPAAAESTHTKSAFCAFCHFSPILFSSPPHQSLDFN